MIEAKNLNKIFTIGKSSFQALKEINLSIHEGEVLGLIGESGSGKSTLGRCLLHLEKPTSGQVLYEGKDIFSLSRKELLGFRQSAQIIFQDPYSSLNPRMRAFDLIAEPLRIHKSLSRQEISQEVVRLIELVGLKASCLERYAHEFSGGQRQRIGIARALALKPKFLVCDEPISSLDASIQAQIVNLLKKLTKELQLTLLFISHDLAMVKYLSDRVAVMYLGSIVEMAPCDQLYTNPVHPYTQSLLDHG